MTFEQGLVFAVIGITLLMLAFQFWRYDLVAMIGMLLLTVFGVISVDEAFSGFGHPAVVTIAAVLVVSRGLKNTGVIDIIARWMSQVGDNLAIQLIVLCGMVVIASAFMNNIAALAIFIPVAVRMSRRSHHPSSLYLLPMAFSSHFGGLITLIGTPTNLVVSELRADQMDVPFGMFEFAPVGFATAIIGVAFIALIGWRMLPKDRKSDADANDLPISDYVAEVKVTPESELAGTYLRFISEVTDAEIWVVIILRGDERIVSPTSSEKIQEGDILLVRGEAQYIEQFVKDTNVELTGSKDLEDNEDDHKDNVWQKLRENLQAEDVNTFEAVVSPASPTIGSSAIDMNLRNRYGINLLGISRADEYLRSSLGRTRFHPSDVLLLQANVNELDERLDELGWLKLPERDIDLNPKNLILGLGIFLAAILLASLNVFSVPLSMTLGAVAMILAGLLSIKDAYAHIDWPILILLGAMLSMGAALEQSGGDQLIADQILRISDFLPPAFLLVIVLFVTMLLSDIVNNTAAVVLMGSISISIAQGLGVSIDPFLVAVAIGGACAFLTPIGHESNVLVFETGGYKFSDYWRLGLPLEILITIVTVPILLWLWPL